MPNQFRGSRGGGLSALIGVFGWVSLGGVCWISTGGVCSGEEDRVGELLRDDEGAGDGEETRVKVLVGGW